MPKIRWWSIALWLIAWEMLSRRIGHDLLLVSPGAVLQRLFELSQTALFWQSVGFSLVRILAGFSLGLLVGILTAVLAYNVRLFGELAAPLLAAIKAVPVASIIIVVLIWVPSRNLSVLIAFMIVLPIVFGNIYEGLVMTDKQLLEMADVFQVSMGDRIRYIYISQLLPYMRSAGAVAFGLAWKSGIAAEIIGVPDGSIGDALYTAKIYLDTADLFAWTVVVVVLSVLFEKLFLTALHRGIGYLERR